MFILLLFWHHQGLDIVPACQGPPVDLFLIMTRLKWPVLAFNEIQTSRLSKTHLSCEASTRCFLVAPCFYHVEKLLHTSIWNLFTIENDHNLKLWLRRNWNLFLLKIYVESLKCSQILLNCAVDLSKDFAHQTSLKIKVRPKRQYEF